VFLSLSDDFFHTKETQTSNLNDCLLGSLI